MLGPFEFVIPSQFASGILDGTYVRYGTIIKDTLSGEIVAHVQETGLAQNLISGISATPFSMLDPVSAVSSIYANIQLEQVKSMIEGLQTLGFATLGASVAGIGVSAVGFSIMNKKLNRIENQISNISNQVQTEFKNLYERELRKHYARVFSFIDQANTALALSNPKNEMIRLASELASESAYFNDELLSVYDSDDFNLDFFAHLVQTIGVCDAARIECLMSVDELQAAKEASNAVRSTYRGTFDSITPVDLVERTSDKALKLEASGFQNQLQNIEPFIDGIREASDCASTRPITIQTLIDKDVSGNQYINSLRNEQQHPIKLLVE